ncbi:TonB family protein [Spongiimicrobium salis]|uniref:TonB family protein n=1 Tax=Spongiimicrobium salis TaxID=1667022 RepID=UPI00374DBFA0
MIQYILECIAFQLLFLVIYELFLKRETFFQWNRAYLIGTYALSLILPWVKIEALGLSVPENYDIIGRGVVQLDALILTPGTLVEEAPKISMAMGMFYMGMLVATLVFGYKLYTLYRLKQKGELRYFSDFTRVIVSQSNLAFSFFKTIFLGDKVRKEDYDHIVAHELVHIQQRHSLDLLFFEVMRIVCWFNPLVYIYQNRISELHEFIADAQVPEEDKTAQYELLLSRVFQTQHISFINPFFKSSLIKKRIVMLQKKESKRIVQLKYVLLLPLVFGMLCYTSCELDNELTETENASEIPLEETVVVGYSYSGNDISGQIEDVPFAVIEEVPIFPGCEDATDKRACFTEKMQLHIRKNFNYPASAQAEGIQGRVSALFTVNKDGDVVNIRKRGPAKILEEEVDRILKKLPQMTPGKQKGRSVNVPYSIPITFRLHGTPPPPPISAQSVAKGNLIKLYTELYTERERLLKSADESSPAVKKLDQEMEILEKKLKVEIKQVNIN